jgi:Ca2+-binding RTX toxin-like protein
MSTPLSATPAGFLEVAPIGAATLAGAEITAFDATSKRFFVTSSGGLQIVDGSDPTAPALLDTITLGEIGFGGDITNVAVRNGLVAFGVPAATKTDPGRVYFADAATGDILGFVEVGALPDMLTFTPDGTKLLVANEGEPLTAENVTTDPVGSISIIDLSAGVASATVVTAGFADFNDDLAALKAAGVRFDAGKTVEQALEPEYIAVAPDGSYALVTLQENNALARLDLTTNTITAIIPLGEKDYSLAENAGDFSDRDTPGSSNAGLIKIRPEPVSGIYQPDAIAAYAAGGQTYFVMANEGDAYDNFGGSGRDDVVRVGNATLDTALLQSIIDDGFYASEAEIKDNDNLGRLNVSKFGDTDNDGDLDKLIAFGGRSFSIRDADGDLVFDSGSLMERAIALLDPTRFNANDGVASAFDTRSHDKAMEPEGVAVGQIGGRTYAFVALERAGGGLMTFDITDPTDVTFEAYSRREGDVSGEGVLFIPAAQSPNGNPLVVLSNELSFTMTIFDALPREADGPGGAGNDTIQGSIFRDVLTGAAGNDVMLGGAGADRLFGNLGRDALFGGAGNDSLGGNNGADTLQGDAGDDRLDGLAGSDLLLGGKGDDTVVGHEGADTLAGGEGDDTLAGGVGADAYLFAAPGQGTDRILDFGLADTIVVSAAGFDGLAAGVALTGAQFTAGSAAVGGAAQFVWNDAANQLWWDADGADAGAAVLVALLPGKALLTAADFVVVA